VAAGAVTLADIHSRGLVFLDVACAKCERRGRYRVGGLIARYGAQMGLPHLKEILSADCPRAGHISPYERCGVHYPGLAAVPQRE
jgi:hypothetical protein